MSRLLQVVFADWREPGVLDLEAVEMAVRGAMHRAGAAALSHLLTLEAGWVPQVPCPCGAQAQFHSHRPKRLLTAVGPVEFQRAYYVCPRCHHGHSPQDRQLDVDGHEFSPGVRRMMALVGADTSFRRGREQLEWLAGLQILAKAVERQAEALGADLVAREQPQIRRAKQLELPVVGTPVVPVLYIQMDGTGIPMVKAETEGRAGKLEGQPAHTREVKLGCVFTQTATDADGRPVRDEDSTSYVAAIETAEEFGLRIYTEAWRRGWSRAQKKVVIADGALWIWNLADQHFPGALQIVDLYHARQHLWELSAQVFAHDERARQPWMTGCLRQLDRGQIGTVVQRLRALGPLSPDLAKLVRNQAEYFERNANRMDYPAFRKQGLFVGSGVVEAGCKEVIGSRLKRSGMFWTVRGANAIIALRCCRLSGRWEDYWESRSQAA